jgi:hypothetical protein
VLPVQPKDRLHPDCLFFVDHQLTASARRSLVLDSHQFIEEFLVVVADAEDVLLILFGQGAAVL